MNFVEQLAFIGIGIFSLSIGFLFQHLEIMMWCAKHQFLENVRSRHASFTSWHSQVRQRKSAATERAWYDPVNNCAESTKQDGSLFIEDALANLEIEQEFTQGRGEELDITSLHKDDEGSSFVRSKIEGVSGCYPFENLRAAVDILFLHGSSDLVLAKQAIVSFLYLTWILDIRYYSWLRAFPFSHILCFLNEEQFLYYLFDRHWTMPDENWRHIVDDFAATFSITRHSLLESLTFYLLDDQADEALQVILIDQNIHPKLNADFAFHQGRRHINLTSFFFFSGECLFVL